MSRKTRVLCLAACVLALVAPVAAQRVLTEASVPRMRLTEFKQALDAGQLLVIDVRDAASYAEGHIPGAMLVPLADIQKEAPALRASKKRIATYCA